MKECNNFVREKDIERRTIYMGEAKISSSQSWAWIKNTSSNSLKPRCCFCLSNWVLSWPGPNWMLNSSHVWMVWNVICECRSQTKIKMLGVVCCILILFLLVYIPVQFQWLQQRDAYFVFLVDKISPAAYPAAYISLWQKEGSCTAVPG